jgi:hypothetical protein
MRSTPFISPTTPVGKRTASRTDHTGYGCVKGQKATPDSLDAVFEGLETNGLGNYDKILTGYVPGAEALEVVEKRIKVMMDRNPEIIYILDRESISFGQANRQLLWVMSVAVCTSRPRWYRCTNGCSRWQPSLHPISSRSSKSCSQ